MQEVIDLLNDLKEDNTIPKNIKVKLDEIAGILKQGEELSIKVNKALNELDEINNDANLEAYTRSQIWGITSKLELLIV